jgi:hypothetical protein
MTENYPITPSLELVKQWEIDATLNRRAASLWTTAFATQAAQWGADQELGACCEWTAIVGGADALRAARRPKPPSLKQQALNALQKIEDNDINATYLDSSIIRRALEALDD